jgi:lipoprotein-anchoring transpeptidase ErfK/SrfK
MEGRNYVMLSRGTIDLIVGYRRQGEESNICCRRELPEGEVLETGTLVTAGQEIPRAVLKRDDEVKAVIYNGTQEFQAGSLAFVIYLEDFSADPDAADIPGPIQAQADRIVESLEIREPTAVPPTSPPYPTRIPSTPEPTLIPPTEVPPYVVAGPDGVNVRTGPGTTYVRRGALAPGERAGVTGRYGDWWRIAYEGDPGWVYGEIVTATNGASVPELPAPPTPVPPSPTLVPSPTSAEEVTEERWIDVDLSEQQVTAYEEGEPVRTITVSTGLPGTPTPTGQFRIWIKLRHDDMSGPDYYLEDVPYVMYFYQGYGFHGTFWHTNFGHRMSHGCVNLPTEEAAWLFDFADIGTLVNVHE